MNFADQLPRLFVILFTPHQSLPVRIGRFYKG